jgi:hypothetical protein
LRSPVSFEAGGVRYVWTRNAHDLWMAVRMSAAFMHDGSLRPASH